MSDSKFWKQLRDEFLAEAIRFSSLTAIWKSYFGKWVLWWEPNSWAVPPECLQVFNEIAKRALQGLVIPEAKGKGEPWQLWLEFLRKRRWRGLRVTGRCAVSDLVWEAGVRIGRAPVDVRRELGLSSNQEPDADHWLEDLTVKTVFRTSAECCEDLALTLEWLRLPPATPIAAADASKSVERQTNSPAKDPNATGRPTQIETGNSQPPRSQRRQHARQRSIDNVLRQIAMGNPDSHRAVFEALDGRVPVTKAEPFHAARGWAAGFQKNASLARAWLSRHWSRLNLPPFPRGPK